MRGKRRKIDENGFLTCLGAPNADVKSHRAHITWFSLSGGKWWFDAKNGIWYGRPGSYCKACHTARYFGPKNLKTEDDIYVNATASELHDWADLGDVKAGELYAAWLDDLKNGRPNDRLTDND
jgi:hypothetical protein